MGVETNYYSEIREAGRFTTFRNLPDFIFCCRDGSFHLALTGTGAAKDYVVSSPRTFVTLLNIMKDGSVLLKDQL